MTKPSYDAERVDAFIGRVGLVPVTEFVQALIDLHEWPNMNPDFKERWLLDLSTAKQGRGTLRSLNCGEPTYCCLGRAVIVAGGEFVFDTDGTYSCGMLGGVQLTLMEYLDEPFAEAELGIDYATMRVLARINDRSEDFGHVMRFIREAL